MFWESEASKVENSLHLLLKEDDLKLPQVLNDPFLLQELRSNNQQLIDFLTREDILLEIVNTALRPVIDTNLPPKDQYRHAHMCSDILTVRNYADPFRVVVERDECKKALRDFFEVNEEMNPVVAGFYTKILNQFVSKYFKQMQEILEDSCFIEKCLLNIRFGAISELLQTFIRLPQTYEESDTLKQWLISQSFVKRLLSLLEPDQPELVLENVAETYSEILRDLREKLYSSDEKTDPLHDEMQSDEAIQQIITAMLKTDENGDCYPSLFCAAADCMIVLIESNFVLNTPSHQLDASKQGGGEIMNTWHGGRPSDQSEQNDQDNEDSESARAEVWRPDKERRAETAVVKYADQIVSIAIKDLRTKHPSVWNHALKLIAHLLDTNHLPTHCALLDAFRKAHFQELLEMVWELPSSSIFHRQLHQIISFAMYSVFPDSDKVESPLIPYFFKEISLPSRLHYGVNPHFIFSPLCLSAMRSFHIHLALQLRTAITRALNGQVIEKFLKEYDKWPEVEQVMIKFAEVNKSDIEGDSSILSSARSNGSNFDGMQSGNPVDSDLSDRNRFVSSFRMSPLDDAALSVLSGALHSVAPNTFDSFDSIPFDQQISIHMKRADYSPKLPSTDINKDDTTEAEFDDLSRLRLDRTSLEDWPLSPASSATAAVNSRLSPKPSTN
ncbi:hypothetical protein WR25_26643 [Diploscapter pachys]|uniref:Uncharacterized protein n=1 Tax=Diploscapter pachys TaxID=2018661 RepID=A0A2A2KHZ7_9BILA|nr:hypothetical protein WR25_26643 [Diploscapter pachys]